MGAIHQVLLGMHGTAGGSGASDNFNRADDASSLGTSSSGHAWTALEGTWGTISNQGYMSATGGSGENFAVIDVGTGNVTVQCTFPTFVFGGGMCFRVTDVANLIVWYPVNFSVIQCWKRVSGGWTELFSLSEAFASGDILKAVCSGNSIELYRNGTLKTTITESFNSTAGKHGLYKSGTSLTGRWDDFSVTP